MEQFIRDFSPRKEIDQYFLKLIFPDKNSIKLGEELRAELKSDLMGLSNLMGREISEDLDLEEE